MLDFLILKSTLSSFALTASPLVTQLTQMSWHLFSLSIKQSTRSANTQEVQLVLAMTDPLSDE